MIEKEIREIRRRFNPEKSNITAVRGCIVNTNHEIVTQFCQSLATTSAEDAEAILKLMKRTLSGNIGTNLLNMDFSTEQVQFGEEHALLMRLKKSSLGDEEAVSEIFSKIAESVFLDGNYVILLAYENYDVFSFSSDGEKSEDSSEVYSYIICSICPIKSTKPALSFQAYDSAFHRLDPNSVLSAPQLGFLFPAFDDRRENIHSALYYTHDIAQGYDDFIDAIFKTPIPVPAAVQKETFDSCLVETVEEECDFELIKSVHEQVSEIVEEHKQTKNEEPLMLSKRAIKEVLSRSGIDDSKVEAFAEKFEEEFGKNAEVSPTNIVNTKKFEVALPDIKISINPERKDLITTQIINGSKYILIRADEGVEVNGVNVHIK